MKLLGKIGDRLLGRVVPKAVAHARPCEVVYRSYCAGTKWIECVRDICANKNLGCAVVSSGC
ncbi:hypothetical protein Afil01_33320 [Actinorhabdospora filicis]|uniref:Uncharacterized protein n=1 Tax=Actinorhabdospora filicis TaxID=1785913 RepID=A0A9W6SMB6_9ACTN|nr:hypothetical protein [Actinorhabdospora filicis]GLZ78525.1 hypothetical protein Afil01_33320 [Actinorhabdospora filicis]